jgi:hypothetical protein
MKYINGGDLNSTPPWPEELRRLLVERFTLEELKLLAANLRLDWDELAGEQKSGKVWSLLEALAESGRLPELLALAEPLLCYLESLKNTAEKLGVDFYGRDQLRQKHGLGEWPAGSAGDYQAGSDIDQEVMLTTTA